MAADGTPDFAAIRCGEEIARLRTLRNWSRPKLIAQLLDELDDNDPNHDSISEGWLTRLENGRMVKIHRQTIEALCRALQCTKKEHSKVLLYADRNTLTVVGGKPSTVEELLNYTFEEIQTETKAILSELVDQHRSKELDEQEMLELTMTALEMVIKSRRD